MTASLLALVGLPGAALAAEPALCPDIPLPDRLEEADGAFVGRLVARRDEPSGGGIYRFDVRQRVKGPIGSVVELRADEPLTDADGRPLARGAAVGVLAGLDGAALTTSSCLLTDPAALLAVADEPRGTAIKVALGVLILGLVVGWSVVRRRRGTRPQFPGLPPAASG